MAGSELLLRQPEALRFIEDCRARGLTILGMDFFEERGDHLVAHTNAADYSALSRHPHAVERIADKARALIKDGLPGIPGVVERTDWVTFVLAEEPSLRRKPQSMSLCSGLDSRVRGNDGCAAAIPSRRARERPPVVTPAAR